MALVGERPHLSLILNYNLNDIIPLNNITFAEQIKTDEWNHIVFAEIIKSLNIPHSNSKVKINNQEKSSLPLIKKFLFWFKNAFFDFLPIPINNFFIIILPYHLYELLQTLKYIQVFFVFHLSDTP